jgi:hypothetical protein
MGSRLNKVLINGESGLNVLFTKILKKMKLDITHMLTKSTSPFYGIVPGNAAIPLGSVVLPVNFRETRENYRTEYIKFEVADFDTSYHAILGRPAIAKFMAVPHNTFLVLIMPSPAGVLSLQGDLKIKVKPVTCPKADRVLDFLDELVHRYRLPHRIITDLGSNFNNHQFWE